MNHKINTILGGGGGTENIINPHITVQYKSLMCVNWECNSRWFKYMFTNDI